MTRRPAAVAAAVACVLTLAAATACTAGQPTVSSPAAPAASGRLPGASTAPPTAPPPAARAEPWAERPVVRLGFDVDPGTGKVRGREDVRFTPDRRVCELVFRLWANKPELAKAGTRTRVSTVSVDGRQHRFAVRSAGGPDRRTGTLVEVPLPRCRPSGTAVRVRLEFGVTLGADASERAGYGPANRTAYLATAFPLLAWERGRGWMRDPAVPLFGEMAGSEAFQLAELAVTAPDGYEVAGTGARTGEDAGPRPGTRVHRFQAAAVRDVAVAVGEYHVAEREVDGVRIHAAAPAAGSAAGPEAWVERSAEAMRRLTGHFGPYPYSDLWVTVVPQVSTGIEFPGSIFFGDVDPAGQAVLVVHELAHMWFYGLVGNDQGRDPWLDESFATYAEALVNGNGEVYRRVPVPSPARGALGRSMPFWARTPEQYGVGVYAQGGAALLEARRRAGPERFDAAMRNYVDRNAHRLARPEDVAAALRELPEARAALDEAGAFRRE